MICASVGFVGCQQKMAAQPSYATFQPSEFFGDGRSARPLVAGTVARGQLRLDAGYFTGRKEEPKPPAAGGSAAAPAAAQRARGEEFVERGAFVDEFPLPVDEALVEHGYHRYMIYCVVCHDVLGTGEGKIVERGYTRPPSYHTQRLREAPVGRLFAVATEGYGSMPSYVAQIPPRDRWAIVAYIRALQLSQHFPEGDASGGGSP